MSVDTAPSDTRCSQVSPAGLCKLALSILRFDVVAEGRQTTQNRNNRVAGHGGGNQCPRQNFSLGKQMSARSGNIEEMENGLRDSMGGNGEWVFFVLDFLVILLFCLVELVWDFVVCFFLTAFKFCI